MTERRMDAYYYSFDATGVEVVDKIIGAVACAGKAYHHTDDWTEETNPYDDHTGKTPIEWIQNAAKEAAERIAALEKALQTITKTAPFGRPQMIARAALEGKDD